MLIILRRCVAQEGVKSHAVATAVLQPGDGLFIPMGYFHTVASGSVDQGGPQAIGISINFPVICDRSVYTRYDFEIRLFPSAQFVIIDAGNGCCERAARVCEVNFARDFPHRQQELRVKRDYAGGASFNAPKGLDSTGRRRRRSVATGRRNAMTNDTLLAEGMLGTTADKYRGTITIED